MIKILHVQRARQRHESPRVVGIAFLRDIKTLLGQMLEKLSIVEIVQLLEKISSGVCIQNEIINVGQIRRLFYFRGAEIIACTDITPYANFISRNSQ